MFGFIDLKTALTIAHLLGVVFGAGGAFLSDLMFMRSIKDRQLTKTEIGFLKLGGNLVTFGLLVLILTGAGIFALDPVRYMASSKFLAKMAIVGVIAINGYVLHRVHIKRIERHVDHHLPSSDEFTRNRWKMMVSGAVSVVSWLFALALGSLRAVPYSFSTILFFYAGIVAIAIATALIVMEYILPSHKRHKR